MKKPKGPSWPEAWPIIHESEPMQNISRLSREEKRLLWDSLSQDQRDLIRDVSEVAKFFDGEILIPLSQSLKAPQETLDHALERMQEASPPSGPMFNPRRNYT